MTPKKAINYFMDILIRYLLKLGIRKKNIALLLNREKITWTQIDELTQMRRKNETSKSPFKASEIWLKLNNHFEDIFYWNGLNEVETCTDINEFFSSPSPRHPVLLRYACYMLYCNIRQRDVYDLLSIPVRPKSDSGIVFNFDDKFVTWDKLISIDTIYSLIEFEPKLVSENIVVLDLGAGWGRIGYFLKNMNPKITYIVCDLPESLLISSSYLPQILPKEKFYSFSELQNIEINKNLLSEGNILFIGTQDIERIPDKSVDIFINIASFQEMTSKQVTEYFEIINNKVSGVFFTQQLYNSKTHGLTGKAIEGYESYPFKSDWERLYLRNCIFSDLYFECQYRIR